MYDDYPDDPDCPDYRGPARYSGDEPSSWYGDGPPPGPMVHLCPECRDLMTSVVSLVRRLPERRPEPDWSRALRWLDAVCGGRDAVLSFDTGPLVPDGLDLPAAIPPERRQRLESSMTLLDATSRRFFDDEARTAFVRGLLRLHERQPAVVTGARSASLLTLGVVWAVGHANGLLHPRGTVTEKELKPYLNVTQSGAAVGRTVVAALSGPFDWDRPAEPWGYGWRSARDLEVLGRTDLLVSGLRRQLLEVRERALAAEAAARDRAA